MVYSFVTNRVIVSFILLNFVMMRTNIYNHAYSGVLGFQIPNIPEDPELTSDFKIEFLSSYSDISQ